MTWDQSAGLTMYVDGIMIGDDVTGSNRVYTAPDFDQFRELVIGAANHVTNPPQTSMRIYDVTHWDQRLTAEEVNDLAGMNPRKLQWHMAYRITGK